ncbi:carbohydrate-binding module family 12 protein [Mycena galopus ATCC 62051]|nr:carbohydrate-binding module family 12 protein [Mycena galopus ATCC 62051]
MPELWIAEGKEYFIDDVVESQGNVYKCTLYHRSQSDWTPQAAHSLWKPIPRHEGGEHREHHEGRERHEHREERERHEYRESEKPQSYMPSTQSGLPSGEGANVHHEERKKHWYDLDDHRKKELEVGGGLLAGAALLAGGYAAFKTHEKGEEEKKAQTWALQNWVHDAEARTAEYHQSGARGPATWILNEGKVIPEKAILVGKEHSWNLYICRAFYNGGLQIGKASEAFQKGAVIGYKHEEIQLGTYEILVGDMRGLRWVDAHGRLNVASLGYTPVEGGKENDGTLLYIAEAPHKGAVHPGKASEKLDGAYIPYDGGEQCVKSYRVLCYA